MSEGGPLLTGAAKAEQETVNTDQQLEFLTELVVDRTQTELRESHVLAVQRIAVADIYLCGGTYRDVRWNISISDSLHKPPEAAAVPGFVLEAIEWINATRSTERAIMRAAYALWRFNWIHPFRGGNGRTARAVSYQILCMDLGAMIPGTPTIPRRIAARRDDYLAALRAADRSVPDPYDGSAMPDLSQMVTFLEGLSSGQLDAAIAEATT